MDKSTIGGIFLAVGGILAGLLLEGGRITQILQPTAAMIVLGGTIGAVMVQFPLATVVQAFKGLASVLLDKAVDPRSLIATLVGFANRARKNGIVSLDSELSNITDPFLKKALMLAVDGIEPDELRKMMELELDNQHEHSEKDRSSVRIGRRFRANHWHYRSRPRIDSGDAAFVEYRRSG